MTTNQPSEFPLPALAPRALDRSQQSSSNTTPVGERSDPSRPGLSSRSRSSHRSRAGCWTCRQRKVKCDEARPRCGQCTRLHKTCDWEQRWKFDDSTRATQDKFSNVTTAGNIVWDPFARRPSSFGPPMLPHLDDLPSFAELLTDDDRERKAEIYAPGTFNVIVNSSAFHDDSQHDDLLCPPLATGSRALPNDPNTVLLTRFDDLGDFPEPLEDEASTLASSYPHHDALFADIQSLPSMPYTMAMQSPTDDVLLQHYERFIRLRLYPLLRFDFEAGVPDPILEEARVFAPLHHAICALSLLSLYYQGHARWDAALEREALATQALSRSINTDEDLNCDGILYLHILLMAYDLCNPINEDNTWVQHLQQIKRIVQTRTVTRQPLAEVTYHLYARATALETQAALAGKDMGFSYVPDLLGDFWAGGKVLVTPLPPSSPYHMQEMELLTPIALLTHRMTAITKQMSQIATQFRSEAVRHDRVSPAHQHTISNFWDSLDQSWAQFYPPSLPPDDLSVAQHLTPRCKELFQVGSIMHCSNIIFAHNCMYPGQALTHPPQIASRTTSAARKIITLARALLSENTWTRSSISFAVFLAGVCSHEPEVKAASIQLVEQLEARCIGRNASKAKALLIAVVEEQQRRTIRGGRPEEVHWIDVAGARGMDLINFGL